MKELTIGTEVIEREYFVSWQSTISSVCGCDDRMLTYAEAIDLAEDLNKSIPTWHHFVAKRLRPKGKKDVNKELPQGTYLTKGRVIPKIRQSAVRLSFDLGDLECQYV